MPRFLLGPLFVFCKKICGRELSHVLTSKIRESQSNDIGQMPALLGPPERLPDIAELSKLVHCTSNVLAVAWSFNAIWSGPLLVIRHSPSAGHSNRQHFVPVKVVVKLEETAQENY